MAGRYAGACWLMTKSVSYQAGRLTRRSRITFGMTARRGTGKRTLKAPPTRVPIDGKFGMQIEAGQRITQLGLRIGARTLTVKTSREVSKELSQTFGAGRGQKWVGFTVSGAEVTGPPPIMDVTLQITFRPRRPGTFQLVPLVLAFGNQPFSRHYVLGATVLEKSREKVNTLIEVP